MLKIVRDAVVYKGKSSLYKTKKRYYAVKHGTAICPDCGQEVPLLSDRVRRRNHKMLRSSANCPNAGGIARMYFEEN